MPKVLKMENDAGIVKERQALNKYLSEKQIPIELITAEIGTECLDKLVLGLAVMGKQMEEAAEAAREGHLQTTAYLLGAGAKITKDEVYGVLVEAYGGMQAISERGMAGTPMILGEYISSKYEGGVKRCELLINSLHENL